MKGQHRIIIQNKRIRYDFVLRRNLTILRGDSATGKTTLVDMVREHMNHGVSSSIQLTCDKTCMAVDGETWRGQLSEIQDSIVFIDEGNPFVKTHEFTRVIQDTDNYYVIVSREGLPNLPYSVEEVYGIRDSGKYGNLKQVYNTFYRVYGQNVSDALEKPKIIITEDSNSGFQFFDVAFSSKIICKAAGGKSAIIQELKNAVSLPVLVVADGAAFGCEMDRVTAYLSTHENIKLFLPESFEWMILQSGLIRETGLTKILKEPAEHIESSDYISWERFFTSLLINLTKSSHFQYSKSEINPAYTSDHAVLMILRHFHYLGLIEQSKLREKFASIYDSEDAEQPDTKAAQEV